MGESDTKETKNNEMKAFYKNRKKEGGHEAHLHLRLKLNVYLNSSSGKEHFLRNIVLKNLTNNSLSTLIYYFFEILISVEITH